MAEKVLSEAEAQEAKIIALPSKIEQHAARGARHMNERVTFDDLARMELDGTLAAAIGAVVAPAEPKAKKR